MAAPRARGRYAHLDLDGERAFRTAAERLLGFGHTRIALLNAPPIYMFAHHRALGWRAALAAAGPRSAPPCTPSPPRRTAIA